jgi:hypothetical protein
MSRNKDSDWAQSYVDNLNWNMLREHYEHTKNQAEFNSMTQEQIEQWFFEQFNKTRKEQGLEIKTIEYIRELLKLPYSSSN